MSTRLSITSDWKPAARCPAAWHAQRVAKTWTPPVPACFATGSLFHAALLTPDRIPAVYREYGDLLTLTRASGGYVKGDPNAAARDTLADAEYTRGLPQIAELLDGARCEVQVEFELGGMAWVAHVDIITAAGCICDVKTCRDIAATEWSDFRKRRLPWHEAMLYWHQLALYRRALGGAEAVALIAVQHCDDGPPDVRIIELAPSCDDLLDQYAADIERSMAEPWTSPVTGLVLAPFCRLLEADTADLPRCESCAYCRQTRTDLYFPHAIARERGL